MRIFPYIRAPCIFRNTPEKYVHKTINNKIICSTKKRPKIFLKCLLPNTTESSFFNMFVIQQSSSHIYFDISDQVLIPIKEASLPSSSAVVLNLLGSRDQFCGEIFFPGNGGRIQLPPHPGVTVCSRASLSSRAVISAFFVS